VLSVLSRFAFPDKPLSCAPYGGGHIHDTRLVACKNGEMFILQRINTHVFTEPVLLMRNIERVCAHLRQKTHDLRQVLSLVPAHDGRPFAVENGEYWRVFRFVENSVCFDRADAALFYESGAAFGQFLTLLADFPVQELAETIPHFHDTPARFATLRAAVKQDPLARGRGVQREIDFALRYEAFSHTLTDLAAQGALPLRVTHNDTKINNVLFDQATLKALCVIDLDTVMPGLCATDFGDAIRYGASTAAEDEPNLDLVRFDTALFKSFASGYLSACGGSLTDTEIAVLPAGARMMALENGVRFLTDYLSGDRYYHISRPEENLDRARTQFRLLEEMDAHEPEMHAIIAKIMRQHRSVR
jgi:Ser/Thr protein kinase RdoA (MazF antagonist)